MGAMGGWEEGGVDTIWVPWTVTTAGVILFCLFLAATAFWTFGWSSLAAGSRTLAVGEEVFGLSTQSSHHTEEIRRKQGDQTPLHGAVPAVGLPGESKQVFISYAWGDDTTEEGRRHEQQVRSWCSRIASWGYEVIWDKNRMQPGDQIKKFIELAGVTPRVLVILNAKYLRSEFCMRELHEVYLRCQNSKEFQKRIVHMALPGACFSTKAERTGHGLYWREEFHKQASEVRPGITPASDYTAVNRMFLWAQAVPEMLALLADVLHSVGFNDDPEKIRTRLA
jgi:hypothetical protein